MMRTRRITPILGIEAWPVSLDSIDSKDVWQLLAQRGVIVLRGLKKVSRKEFVTFGARLGNLEASTRPVQGFPKLTYFTHDATHPATENIWHSDMSFLNSPPLGRILRSKILPEAGGDTLFADMRWVLNNLPKGIFEAIEGLEAEHDIVKHAPLNKHKELHAHCPPTNHPLIKFHPISNDRYLFCNTAYTTRVLGITPDESKALLNFLFTRVLMPEAQCRVRWDLETIVIWDNRHLQHYAVGDYFPATRSMERLTIID